MQNTFDNKFKTILKSKRNRCAVYDFIDEIVQENPLDAKPDLFYFYMYEIYTEYMIIPKLEASLDLYIARIDFFFIFFTSLVIFTISLK